MKQIKHKTVVNAKGQITIPAEIRLRYGIRAGTEVRIQEVRNGLLLEPITEDPIDRVRGILAGMRLPDRIEKERDRKIR